MEDNYSLWESKNRREERWMESRPKCSYCGHPIQGERLFDIEGELYHRRCAVEQFEKDTEDYIA